MNLTYFNIKSFFISDNFIICENSCFLNLKHICTATTNILNNLKIIVKFIFIFVSTNVEQNSTMLCKVAEAGYPHHIKRTPSY